MKTQLDFLKEAVALAELNPHLKIHFAATNGSELDFLRWTEQHICKVEKSLYCIHDEETISLSVDEVMDYCELVGEDITEEAARSRMEEVILIHTC
jgi:hypothetical protein